MRWILIAAATLIAAPAAADPIYDACMKPGKYGPEQCDCVAEELRRELPAEDHALYSAVTGRYLDRLGEGLAMADAWDAAVQSEAMARQANFAAILGTTNAIGKRHREAIGRCGG